MNDGCHAATSDDMSIKHDFFDMFRLYVDGVDIFGHIGRLNQVVKRNIACFPEQFRFQLTKEEKHELVTNCDLQRMDRSFSNHFSHLGKIVRGVMS
jgi:hypothetical protein